MMAVGETDGRLMLSFGWLNIEAATVAIAQNSKLQPRLFVADQQTISN